MRSVQAHTLLPSTGRRIPCRWGQTLQKMLRSPNASTTKHCKDVALTPVKQPQSSDISVGRPRPAPQTPQENVISPYFVTPPASPETTSHDHQPTSSGDTVGHNATGQLTSTSEQQLVDCSEQNSLRSPNHWTLDGVRFRKFQEAVSFLDVEVDLHERVWDDNANGFKTVARSTVVSNKESFMRTIASDTFGCQPCADGSTPGAPGTPCGTTPRAVATMYWGRTSALYPFSVWWRRAPVPEVGHIAHAVCHSYPARRDQTCVKNNLKKKSAKIVTTKHCKD